MDPRLRVPLFIALVACGGWDLCAQDVAPASQESRPASRPADFTSEGMTARLRSLLPEIEAVLGGPLGGPPLEVVASTRDDVAAMDYEQSVVIFSAIDGSLRGDELRSDMRANATSRSWRLAGAVGLATDRIHILPSNFRSGATQSRLDVILIHEAVHVFQNRRLGAARMLGRVRSLDDFAGVQALLEGHADWVAHRVAERIGIADAFEEHRRRVVDIGDVDDDPMLEQAARAVVEMVTFAYIEGEKFFDTIVKQRGYPAAVAELFRRPPRSQHAVRNPAGWGKAESRGLDPAELGKRLCKLMPEGYRTQAIAAHDGLVRVTMALLDKKRVDEALTGYRFGTVVMGWPVENADPERMYYASLFVHETPEQSATWFDASIELLHQKDEQMAEHIEASEYGEKQTVDGVTYLFARKKVHTGNDTPLETVVLLARKDAGSTEIGSIGAAVPDDQMLALARKVLTEGLDPGPATRPAPDSREVEGSPEEPPAAESAPAYATISGRVAYEGRNESPRELSITFWSLGDAARPVTVATGRDGRFEVELPTHVPTRVGMIVADGERHDGHVGARVRVVSGREVVYAVSKAEFVEIAVIDGVTSRPVADARVYVSTQPGFRERDEDDIVVPDEDIANPERTPLRTDERGRVRFKRSDEAGPLGPPREAFAVSARHAWGRADLPPSPKEDCEIVLQPGGSLRVAIEHWKDLSEATVAIQRCAIVDRRYDFSYPHDLPAPDENGTILVEGLKPGLYGVVVVRGRYYKDGPLYGSELAEVKAGEISEIAVKTAIGPSGVALGGTLAIPEGYGRVPRELELNLIGDEPATKGAVIEATCKFDPKTRTASFEFPNTTQGKWKLAVGEIQWVTDVEARAGASPLDLKAPAPVEAEIEVVDQAGETIKRPALSWSATEPLRVYGDQTDGTWDNEAQVVRFKAAPGSGTLRIHKKQYKDARLTLQLEEGKKFETKVTLEPAAGIAVAVRAEGKPFRGDLDVTVSSADGRDTKRTSIHGSRTSFDDLDAGKWTVTLANVPGFKAVPSREVETVLGKTVEVVFELEKGE